jgi:hypothetical protein
LNAAQKAEWVAALRSGKYGQAQRCLTDLNGGYCCLGVLCDLHVGERGKWVKDFFVFDHSQSCAITPAAFEIYLGEGCWAVNVPEDHPLRQHPWFAEHTAFARLPRISLVTLNDEGAPFSLIADLIEAFLPTTEAEVVS